MVVTIPYPGASPETVEREIINRIEKSLQSIPRRRPRSRSTANEGSAQIVHAVQLQEEHDRGRRTRCATPSPRCATSCRSRCASRSCTRVDPSAQPIMQLALSSEHADATPRSRAWPKTSWPTASAASTASPPSTSTARSSASCRCCCTREAARVQRLGHRRRQRAARAEHQRAGGQGARRARRAEHPPGRPHRVARTSSSRSSSSATATRSCAWARSPTIEDGFAEHRQLQPCAAASPTSASRSRARATRRTVTVAKKVREMVEEINKDAAGRHQARSHAGRRRRRRRDSLNNVIEALVFGAVPDHLRGLRLPQLLALDADHGAVAADLGASPPSSPSGCAASR